jgi:hypothetical protein
MSKKHFIAIAEALKTEVASLALCIQIAGICKHANPRFDVKRFLTACGY